MLKNIQDLKKKKLTYYSITSTILKFPLTKKKEATKCKFGIYSNGRKETKLPVEIVAKSRPMEGRDTRGAEPTE